VLRRFKPNISLKKTLVNIILEKNLVIHYLVGDYDNRAEDPQPEIGTLDRIAIALGPNFVAPSDIFEVQTIIMVLGKQGALTPEILAGVRRLSQGKITVDTYWRPMELRPEVLFQFVEDRALIDLPKLKKAKKVR
jgi:hypothetical protein